MKIAVSSLLLLATLVQWQFVTGLGLSKKKYIQPSPGVCLKLIWENIDAYKMCRSIATSRLTCEFVATLFGAAGGVESSIIAIQTVLDNACKDVKPTTTPEPTTTLEPEKDVKCGNSASLRLRQPFMAGAGGGRGRIVGGEYVSSCSTIPWQVYLEAGPFMCGGSIITKNHILTAAHCFTNISFNADLVTVWVGSHDLLRLAQYGKGYGVVKLKAHESYNKFTHENDIAILTLNDTLSYSRCVSPICRDSSLVPAGHDCIVAGWGRTVYNGQSPVKLKMTKVKTYLGSVCNEKFGVTRPYYVKNGDSQLCAGYTEGKTDACQGDSGGALVCWHNNHYVQTGVVSYGKGCAWPNLPGIYTRVSHFEQWIKDNSKVEDKNNNPTTRTYFDWSRAGF